MTEVQPQDPYSSQYATFLPLKCAIIPAVGTPAYFEYDIVHMPCSYAMLPTRQLGQSHWRVAWWLDVAPCERNSSHLALGHRIRLGPRFAREIAASDSVLEVNHSFESLYRSINDLRTSCLHVLFSPRALVWTEEQRQNLPSISSEREPVNNSNAVATCFEPMCTCTLGRCLGLKGGIAVTTGLWRVEASDVILWDV
ncbi:hypothetical protein BR93DRAFT_602357 [Coniochaeta sp. PMI_546]|nr:hypothetical protein BR93DRAFT_602357 [Coniochaeta sp. PMI_546]